jgi:hypothetical protein
VQVQQNHVLFARVAAVLVVDRWLLGRHLPWGAIPGVDFTIQFRPTF